MGNVIYPEPVSLIMGLIYNKSAELNEVKRLLVEKFGEITFEGQPFLFLFTDYYNKEMGKELYRNFIGFEKFIMREDLPHVKGITNNIEDQFRKKADNGRSINIDPGYISLENFILATTKSYSHRVYIGMGMYADLVYIFHKGEYRVLEWTYPDYKDKEVLGLFNKLRASYFERLKRVWKETTSQTLKC